MIAYSCPSCGQAMKIPSEYAGKSGMCRACGKQFVTPMPSPVEMLPTDTQAQTAKRGPRRWLRAFVVLLLLSAVIGTPLAWFGAKEFAKYRKANIMAYGEGYVVEADNFIRRAEEKRAQVYRNEFVEWFKSESEKTSLNPSSLLIYVCGIGEEKLIPWLIGQGASTEFVNTLNQSPLTTAISGGHELCVLELLKNGADVNFAPRGGNSPLAVAVASDNVELTSHLESVGARLSDVERSALEKVEKGMAREAAEKERQALLASAQAVDDYSTQGQEFILRTQATVFECPPVDAALISRPLGTLAAGTVFTSIGSKRVGASTWVKFEYDMRDGTEGAAWFDSTGVQVAQVVN